MHISFEDIKAAADAQYGSYDIEIANGEVLRLRNALRISDQERSELIAVSEELNQGDDESGEGEAPEGGRPQIEVIRDFIRISADNKDLAGRFLEYVGDDLAILSVVLKGFTEATQVGEALPSQD